MRPSEQDLLEEFKRIFEIGEGGLVYKIWRRGLKSDCVGKRAGSHHDSGYCFVKVKGFLYAEHRVVWAIHTGKPADFEIDHEDGDKRNNVPSNLRQATRGDNNSNRGCWSQSGYKGVYPNKRGKPWNAKITVDKVVVDLGNYNSAEDAARAYDEAAVQHKGKFAKTNFRGFYVF